MGRQVVPRREVRVVRGLPPLHVRRGAVELRARVVQQHPPLQRQGRALVHVPVVPRAHADLGQQGDGLIEIGQDLRHAHGRGAARQVERVREVLHHQHERHAAVALDHFPISPGTEKVGFALHPRRPRRVERAVIDVGEEDVDPTDRSVGPIVHRARGQLSVQLVGAPGRLVGRGGVSRGPARQVVRVYPVDVGVRQRGVVPHLRFIDGRRVPEVEDVVAAAECQAHGDERGSFGESHLTVLRRFALMPSVNVRISGYARMLSISGSYPQSPRWSMRSSRFVPVK